MPPMDSKVVGVLGEIARGELRWYLTLLQGLGGRGRDDDPDPVDVGSGPIPRAVVRLVALEVALWEGGRGVPTVAEVARESGLTESEVELALEVLEVLDDRQLKAWEARVSTRG